MIGNELFEPRRVRLRLPPSAVEGEPLPVLIVLDGQAAFAEFGLGGPLDVLARNGTIDDWAVLAIDSTTERPREFAEEVDHFAAFVIDLVLAEARRAYPLSTAREGIAVLGFSFGGHAAVRMQLARPHVIGRVIAMSPSVWWNHLDVLARLRLHREVLPRRLWIDVGTGEGRGIVPGMVRGARALRDVARERGMIFGRDLGYLEEPNIAHRMDAVAARCRAALAFTLSDTDLSEEAPTALSLHVVRARSRRRTTYAIGAMYREGRYRLTVPHDLAVMEGADEVEFDGPTLRAMRGEEISAMYAGMRARVRL
jgi:predicted alpha/beta superfamily hydrolase